MTLSTSLFEKAVASVDFSYRAIVTNKTETLTHLTVGPSTPFSNETVQVSARVEHVDGHGRLLFYIKARQVIELVHFEASYAVNLDGERMLANGFQSWSHTRELQKEDTIPAIRGAVAWLTQYNLQGDYDIYAHTGDKGLIHSSSFTHFRKETNRVFFFGSLSEQLGYTYFKGDFSKNKLGVYKDVKGKHVEAEQELELIKVMFGEGDEDQLWNAYSASFPDRRALQGETNALRHVNGWTSWYNYYGNVSEEIVLQNVAALLKHQYPINIFQIDDGYQKAIGDWLLLNTKFPNGMPATVAKIKAAGFLAGLWLAPFAVGFSSQLAKDHADWLVQDPETGKPLVAGPNWGGFYALDMYNNDARAYLGQVFQTVLHDWGFDMVKLDFCFAAAMIPRLGKSRGEIMWDAMELVRDLVGPDKLILGCGVPLASAWRKVDYCRIGSDVAPWWEDTALKHLHVRERVSTANSLVSTLTRWAMSDRMFGNDPDVMILRHKKSKLTPDERYTLCVLNNILGSLVFISDNVSEYGADEHLLYAATFPKAQCSVKQVVELRKDVFVIHFTANGYLYTTVTNLSDGVQRVECPASSNETHLLFTTYKDSHMMTANQSDAVFYHPSSEVSLKRHETTTLLHIPLQKENTTVFLGSTSHIVPGAEIERITESQPGDIQLAFRKENHRKHKVYFGESTLSLNEHASGHSIKANQKATRIELIPVCGRGEGRSPGTLQVHVYEEAE